MLPVEPGSAINSGEAESGRSASPGNDAGLDSLLDGFLEARGRDITMADHVFMSLMLMDFVERGGKPHFAAYAEAVNVQVREALICRMGTIIAAYDVACDARNLEVSRDNLWIEAVRNGVHEQMDDVARRQIAAMDELRAIVVQSTSLKSQLLLALGSAFGVAVIIATAKAIISYL